MTTRRNFLKSSLAGGALLGLPGTAASANALSLGRADASQLPPPISNEEREERIARAQALMQQQGLAGIVIEAGTSMLYFSGLGWRQSSRLTALVLPASGDPVVVAPAFEEGKLRELMVMEMEVRTWQEHESPFAMIGGVLDDRGADGAIGLERTARFFVADGLRSVVPSREVVSATPVVSPLRQIKSPREIALMQAANDITMAAYRETYPQIETGMTGSDIAALMNAATRARGVDPVFTLALVGEASSYPHGSREIHTLRERTVILMDCGCDVHGYKSDISRTWVHGEPNAEQLRVWNTVCRGQDIVMETARLGTPIGAIDDAVRRYYDAEGWGPNYGPPGLTHRTGHGIGMDVHEDQFVVRGNETPLEAGMCFSNEPGIYLPGRFGVRSEDCVYMTEDGPQFFTAPAPRINNPMGI
ncbi:M24 family metallopeptidase [Aurantiacibacter sediminis]|uniref:M24 family metallopeptidase n=1 Tax=Aurantiacibacter sediminis TaxID=2793064 RepID=UPI002D7E8968|nr:M24 family metallopeptidase [Aurantiacibacter sediminis]